VTHYPNAVPASRPMVTDPSGFPSDGEMSRYFTIGAVPQAAERARTRLWARFKAGS
jgi:putrescine transport system substrate-binding protein